MLPSRIHRVRGPGTVARSLDAESLSRSRPWARSVIFVLAIAVIGASGLAASATVVTWQLRFGNSVRWLVARTAPQRHRGCGHRPRAARGRSPLGTTALLTGQGMSPRTSVKQRPRPLLRPPQQRSCSSRSCCADYALGARCEVEAERSDPKLPTL